MNGEQVPAAEIPCGNLHSATLRYPCTLQSCHACDQSHTHYWPQPLPRRLPKHATAKSERAMRALCPLFRCHPADLAANVARTCDRQSDDWNRQAVNWWYKQIDDIDIQGPLGLLHAFEFWRRLERMQSERCGVLARVTRPAFRGWLCDAFALAMKIWLGSHPTCQSGGVQVPICPSGTEFIATHTTLKTIERSEHMINHDHQHSMGRVSLPTCHAEVLSAESISNRVFQKLRSSPNGQVAKA